MAKGNLFLGMGRGSVGDVVFYRTAGEQISRARNRHPKNPQTFPQTLQRAITSTVVKAYSQGREIFDHSFEGLAVGAQNQARFLQLNSRKLREQVISELDMTGEVPAVLVGKDSFTTVANEYIVSQGSLTQPLYQVTQKGAEVYQGNDNMSVAAVMDTLGIKSGDIFTVVAFGSYNAEVLVAADESPKPADFNFGFIRIIFEPTTAGLSKTWTQATIADIGRMEASVGSGLPSTTLISGTISLDQVVPSAKVGSMAVIRSRVDTGARSTSVMVRAGAGITSVNDAWGAWPWDIEKFWTATDEIASDLILEGGPMAQ